MHSDWEFVAPPWPMSRDEYRRVYGHYRSCEVIREAYPLAPCTCEVSNASSREQASVEESV